MNGIAKAVSFLARALLIAAFLCLGVAIPAQLAVPDLSSHVVDETGTLDAQQKASLEQTLAAFEARKGSQLAVLIVVHYAARMQ